MGIPDVLRENEYLNGLKLQGRLLRWVAVTIDPTFHTRVIDEGVKRWPEATCLHYMYSPVEDLITETVAQHLYNRYKPTHLSFRYDGVKVGQECVGGAVEVMLRGAQEAVTTETEYLVTLDCKRAHTLGDLLFEISQPAAGDHPSCGHMTGSVGNCVPDALICLNYSVADMA